LYFYKIKKIGLLAVLLAGSIVFPEKSGINGTENNSY
jgi:hypothetical protein